MHGYLLCRLLRWAVCRSGQCQLSLQRQRPGRGHHCSVQRPGRHRCIQARLDSTGGAPAQTCQWGCSRKVLSLATLLRPIGCQWQSSVSHTRKTKSSTIVSMTMRQYRLGDAIKLEEEEEKVTENAQEQEGLICSAGGGSNCSDGRTTKVNAPTVLQVQIQVSVCGASLDNHGSMCVCV